MRYSWLLLALTLAGCARTLPPPEFALTHPAHPQATSGAPSGPPATLIVPDDPVARPTLPVPDTSPRPPSKGEMGLTHTHQSWDSTARMHPDPADPPSPGDPGVVIACPVHPYTLGDPGGQCDVCGLPLLPRRLSHMEMGGRDHDMEGEKPAHEGHEMPSQPQAREDHEMPSQPPAGQGHEAHHQPVVTQPAEDTEVEGHEGHEGH